MSGSARLAAIHARAVDMAARAADAAIRAAEHRVEGIDAIRAASVAMRIAARTMAALRQERQESAVARLAAIHARAVDMAARAANAAIRAAEHGAEGADTICAASIAMRNAARTLARAAPTRAINPLQYADPALEDAEKLANALEADTARKAVLPRHPDIDAIHVRAVDMAARAAAAANRAVEHGAEGAGAIRAASIAMRHTARILANATPEWIGRWQGSLIFAATALDEAEWRAAPLETAERLVNALEAESADTARSYFGDYDAANIAARAGYAAIRAAEHGAEGADAIHAASIAMRRAARILALMSGAAGTIESRDLFHYARGALEDARRLAGALEVIDP